MLNADHLRTFLAVADSGSFTAAAARLGFTQPAVSQQIRALEAQLGATQLFRRSGKRMRLTHTGEELVGHARELVSLAERAERHMLGLQGHVTGRIAIGCAPSTGEHLLPALLAAFHDSHAHVQFTVDVGPTERLLEWLADRVVQVVVVDEHPRRRSLDALPLGCEPVVCLAARGHALLDANTPTLHDLRGLPLIVPQRGTPLRRTIEDLFRRRVGPNAGLTIVLETDSTTLAAQAAADGLGLAFVPQHRVPRTRDIGVLEVTGLEIELNWFLVRTRGLEEGSAVEALWDFAASADGRKLLQHLGLKSAGAFNAADVEEEAQ
jgi:DNA-binding transcriptional LysR family regulator